MRKLSIYVFTSAFLLLWAPELRAEWIRGGLYGADVRALVVHPKNPDLIFIGTSSGELYVSRDGAQSWTSTRRGAPFPGYVVDNLAIDARGRLWAASWGLWGGGVIAVSSDEGATWSRRDGGLEEFSVRAIALDSTDPDLLFAGGLTGVYRSRDAGLTWEKISSQENVESLAIDPRSSDRLYVGTWRQAWRTDDGGATWKHIANGMVLDTDVFSINIDQDNPDDVWLSTCGWVYNSKDAGDSWTRFKDGFNNRRIHAIDRHPLADAELFAGSVAGLYRTIDGGKSWQLASDENLVINAIGIHPKRPDRILLGTEGDGVYVSHDAGKTFTRSNDGLYNVRIAAVIPDSASSSHVWAAVVFGNAASGIYESVDSGRTWAKVSKTRLPEILSLVRVQGDEGLLVAGTEKGIFYSNDGVEWAQAEPSATPVRVDRVIAYSRTRLFAATSEGVMTSRDSGRSWYHLAEFRDRVSDLAVGHLGAQPALYALTATGVVVFDGSQWLRVEGAPSKGHSLAVHAEGESELLLIAGSRGIRAGRIGFDAKWSDAEIGSAPSAAHQVHNLDRTVFLAANERFELLRRGDDGSWSALHLPLYPKDIATISADRTGKRLYVGTAGQGIYVYDPISRGAGGLPASYRTSGRK